MFFAITILVMDVSQWRFFLSVLALPTQGVVRKAKQCFLQFLLAKIRGQGFGCAPERKKYNE